MSVQDTDKRKGLGRAFWCFTGTAVVVVLSCTALVGIYGRVWFKDAETAGQFGDQFGAANALFSGLAFAGVIATLLLQRKELILQREEMTKSTEAQAKSSAALEKRLGLERELAQSRLTLAVHDELLTAEARDMKRALHSRHRVKGATALSQILGRGRPENLVQLIFFLDRCSRLSQKKLIDPELLDYLLDQHILAFITNMGNLEWDLGAEHDLQRCLRRIQDEFGIYENRGAQETS